MHANVPRGTSLLNSSGEGEATAHGPQLVTPWGDVIHRTPTPPPHERRHPALMYASDREYHEQMLYACLLHSRTYRAREITGITANQAEVAAFLAAWRAQPDHYWERGNAARRLRLRRSNGTHDAVVESIAADA